ncbi:MAG: hypothetical protein MUF54_08030 [Polyangiaceae bacterium]|jgi:hypothetical protein|nr:hypothetical protein [Polyangiaceae bacterium]
MYRMCVFAATAVLAALADSACAPPPAPSTPAAAPPPDATPQPAEPVAYSRYTDPMFLAVGEERNVYGRRTLARLWVLDAEMDPTSEAQQQRLGLARETLAKADEAIAVQTDPCIAHVKAALKRAQATKQQLERSYLAIPEQQAQSNEARRLDAQIHMMRDELEQLESLAAQCPNQMYQGDEAGA